MEMRPGQLLSEKYSNAFKDAFIEDEIREVAVRFNDENLNPHTFLKVIKRLRSFSKKEDRYNMQVLGLLELTKECMRKHGRLVMESKRIIKASKEIEKTVQTLVKEQV